MVPMHHRMWSWGLGPAARVKGERAAMNTLRRRARRAGAAAEDKRALRRRRAAKRAAADFVSVAMWWLSTAEGRDLLGIGGAASVGARIAHVSRDPGAS